MEAVAAETTPRHVSFRIQHDANHDNSCFTQVCVLIRCCTWRHKHERFDSYGRYESRQPAIISSSLALAHGICTFIMFLAIELSRTSARRTTLSPPFYGGNDTGSPDKKEFHSLAAGIFILFPDKAALNRDRQRNRRRPWTGDQGNEKISDCTDR